MRTALIIASVAALAGCTDAERSKMATTMGKSVADVRCWSGGRVTYQGTATGKVYSEDGDGWSFVDSSTDRLTEISGDCILRYRKADQPALFITPEQPDFTGGNQE